MSANRFPSPSAKSWPDKRDEGIFGTTDADGKHHPGVLEINLAAFGIEPFEYQNDFLLPPPPYDYKKIKLIILGGAKRIGKSFIIGARASVTPFIPKYTARLYGFQHENCEREFRHIKRLLLDETWDRSLVHLHPELKEHLTDFNDDPDKGRLIMRWAWGSEITSMSWQQNTQWVGEPIDLGVICEPGLLPFAKAYSSKIKSNLMDLRGVCIAAGTVDDPSMKAYHDLAHNHQSSSDIYCVCEVPQWANTELPEYLDDDTAREYIAHCKREMTPRDFAINILGQWENYSNIAYELWTTNAEKSHYIKPVPVQAWRALKKIPANCDHFLALDTGKHCAMGQFIVNPAGNLIMIDGWTNYDYKTDQIVLTDTRGPKSWMADIFRSIHADLGPRRSMPFVIIDPSSQFKLDVQDLGLGCVDAVNAHDYGAGAFNEYLAKRKFAMVRPVGRVPYIAEAELARVRWAEGVSGIQGKHRLEKGRDDDHFADVIRYAAASRPLGTEPMREHKESMVDRDIRNALSGSKPASTLFDSLGSHGDFY